MDEVRMVRERYAEPAPPTAQEIARARALVNDPPRRSLPKLRLGLGGGLVAVGAAAAVLIATTGENAPSGTGPGSPPITLDAKTAFLAAAEKAEKQPMGRYWQSAQVDGQAYIVRARTGTYAITGALTEMFSFHGVRRGDGEGYYGRELGARPQTPQDVALWKKAGSPKTFRVWSGDHFNSYTTRTTTWRSNGPEVGIDLKGGGGKLVGGLTAEELQKLPTDPARLSQFIQKRQRDAFGRGPTKVPKEPPYRPAAVLATTAAFLGAVPTPPKVRAGLMRALAEQPGIKAIGRTTDALGRTGVALASDDTAVTVTGEFGNPKIEQGTYRERTVMVFDEENGTLLSVQDVLTRPGGRYREMKPGFIINYVATHSARWTDTIPKPDPALPFRD